MDILAQMDLEKYGLNVVYEKLNKALYLEVLKAIYAPLGKRSRKISSHQ